MPLQTSVLLVLHHARRTRNVRDAGLGDLIRVRHPSGFSRLTSSCSERRRADRPAIRKRRRPHGTLQSRKTHALHVPQEDGPCWVPDVRQVPTPYAPPRQLLPVWLLDSEGFSVRVGETSRQPI